MDNQVLIIMPAFNEAKSIGPVLKALKEATPSFCDILVINDGSTDNTADICVKQGILVVNLVYHMGYGAGLQVGYKYAAAHDYKYVIQMDADGQHDVSNVRNIYEKLKTVDEKGAMPDVVIGSRFLESSESYKISGLRKFAFKNFSRIIKWGTKAVVTDPTSGLQGLSHRAFSYYQGYSHFDDKYPDANIVMQMLFLGFNVVEIPAVMHERTNGSSMHAGLDPIKYMFRMSFSMISVWLRIKVFKVDMGMPDKIR